jgi:hypothetical protein
VNVLMPGNEHVGISLSLLGGPSLVSETFRLRPAPRPVFDRELKTHESDSFAFTQRMQATPSAGLGEGIHRSFCVRHRSHEVRSVARVVSSYICANFSLLPGSGNFRWCEKQMKGCTNDR